MSATEHAASARRDLLVQNLIARAPRRAAGETTASLPASLPAWAEQEQERQGAARRERSSGMEGLGGEIRMARAVLVDDTQ